MLIPSARAVSFAQARAVEKTYVDEAAAHGEPDRYMLRVAEGVADAVCSLTHPESRRSGEPAGPAAALVGTAPARGTRAGGRLEEASPPPRGVAAFVGGGDNGGDALYACAILARRGIPSTAFLLKRSCHARGLAAAREAGVRVVDLRGRSLRSVDGRSEARAIRRADAWIDGIVGIGARGPLEGEAADSVNYLNELSRGSARPVVAIDVPSGLTDDDGRVRGPILRATHTLAVGAYKRAEILPPAVEFSGALSVVPMAWSLPDAAPVAAGEGTDDATPLSYYDGATRARLAVPAPGFGDDKYARGVVGLVAGSDTYPGAGLLATRGALAAGVGMVRLNSTRRVQDLVLTAEPGVVTVGGRIQAALIGPGLDEERREDAIELANFCGQAAMALVVDAGALDLLPELADTITPEATVLTPHYGEAARLLGRLKEPATKAEVAACPMSYARALHEATGCHVVLKGPVTIVCSPARTNAAEQPGVARSTDAARTRPGAQGHPLGHHAPPCEASVGQAGTSWAGIAGSGDVLAGLIAGVLARPGTQPPSWARTQDHPVTAERLCAAVWLHARAAKVAAERHRGRAPIQARDIADAIPHVLADPAS